ncbi:MAG: DUF4468 domain-containing protein [Bacteroidaceae bacterium]|nr:DUF4468 domain-containing protein [Bacteroidaceae bacterium]
MKKIIIAILAVAFPIMMQAQSEGLLSRKAPKGKADMSVYTVQGAIPEESGKVVFKDIITASGKSKEEIFNKVAQWASLRYEPNSMMGDDYRDANFYKNIEYSRVKEANKQSGIIECQGAEELIFSVKPLAKNFTQAFYLLDLSISDNKVEFMLHTLSFNVDQGEGEFLRMTAEEWITDKECLNKKGELRRRNGKFRIKTIDLVEQLKKEISEAIN